MKGILERGNSEFKESIRKEVGLYKAQKEAREGS